MSARGLMVLGLLAARSHASPVRLETSGDACDLASLGQRVIELVARDPFSPNARARIAIETHADAGGVHAEIRFLDDDGSQRGPRTVVASSCGELVDSAAMVIAMGLPVDKPANKHTRRATPSAAMPPVAPPVEDEPGPAISEPPAVDPAPASEDPAVEAAPIVQKPAPVETVEANPVSPTRGDVGVLATPPSDTTGQWVAGAGLTTSTAFLQFGARWRRDDRSLGTEVRVDLPTEPTVGVASHIHVLRAEASVSPCLHFAAVGACALASIGTIRGSGAELAGGRTAYTPLLSFGLRATWEHAVSTSVAVRAHLDVAALATQTRFDVDGMEVWRSSWLEGALGIAVLTRFP